MLAAQCQVARAILKWSAEDLAERAQVSAETITHFEDGAAIEESLVIKLQTAFEASGVEFTYGDRPGVKIRTLDGIIEVSAGRSSTPTKH